jgi:fructose-1,6-bisphosphatase/sedoheptulose 1,7-bisphosphatase-like protein
VVAEFRRSNSSEGYLTNEWYDPTELSRYILDYLPNAILRRNVSRRHGKIRKVEIRELPNQGTAKRGPAGPINPDIFAAIPDLVLTAMITASSLYGYIGKSNERDLRSRKNLVDSVASSVFAEEHEHWKTSVPTVISEGKDEFGAATPSIGTGKLTQRKSNLRLAIDAVDGTTLVAKGLPGAYSICAIGEGLLCFPDMQAYALLAPKSIFGALDFASEPEMSLTKNLTLIAKALNKRVSDLVVVTHSEDTGLHHSQIRQIMQELGVSVIVPAPVIVEPPYTLGTCIGIPPRFDSIIGVFGLPEIVINALLAGTLNREREYIFRIASNSVLADREERSLKNIFKFTREETNLIKNAGLREDCLYSFDKIVTGRSCAFAGAAITEDRVLGLEGVDKRGPLMDVHGWFSDPTGNLFSVCASFDRPALIDYTARYPLPLLDISLIVEINHLKNPERIIPPILALQESSRRILSDIHLPPPNSLMGAELGLHVTLFEFVVDYASQIDSGGRTTLFEKALQIAAQAVSESKDPLRVEIGIPFISESTLALHATFNRSLKTLLRKISDASEKEQSFNSINMPDNPHITLGRFVSVPSRRSLLELERTMNLFRTKTEEFEMRKMALVAMASTPCRPLVNSTTLIL